MRFVIVPMLMLLAVSITACNENQEASCKHDASEKQAATSKAAGIIDSLFDAYYGFK